MLLLTKDHVVHCENFLCRQKLTEQSSDQLCEDKYCMLNGFRYDHDVLSV